MGSCVVKQSCGALGSSPYSTAVEMAPAGSTHSTRN